MKTSYRFHGESRRNHSYQSEEGHVGSFLWTLLDNGPIFVFTHDYGVVLFHLTPLWSQSGLVRCPYPVKWFLFNRRTARPGHEYGASPAIQGQY